MKKPIYIASVGVFAVVIASMSMQPVLAVNTTLMQDRKEIREVKQENRVTMKKDNATKEIDRRLASLQNLITTINAMKKISADQKTALTTSVNNEITNLTHLKTVIMADTDPATLLTDKKSIVTSYRVYALYMPKVRIMAYADKILDVAPDMKTLTTNADALAKLTDAMTNAQNAINAVTPLTPEGYPGNKTTLESARNMLKTAHTDLTEARKLIK